MAKVQVTNVTVLDNPTAFYNPFQFEITFECLEDLADGTSMCILRCQISYSNKCTPVCPPYVLSS